MVASLVLLSSQRCKSSSVTTTRPCFWAAAARSANLEVPPGLIKTGPCKAETILRTSSARATTAGDEAGDEAGEEAGEEEGDASGEGSSEGFWTNEVSTVTCSGCRFPVAKSCSRQDTEA